MVAVCGLALLGACNVVVTDEPLFTAADEAGAPVMRPGVWSLDRDATCQADERKPLDQWPDCAGGAVFSPGMIAGYDHKDGKTTREEEPFVLASGDPRVGQVRLDEKISTASSETRLSPMGYAGARPTKLDAQGRIVAVTYWPVQCGPPPPPAKEGEEPKLGTLKPLPGMIMKKGDATCTTTSKDALRAAARASEAWADAPMHAHWVRDGAK